MLVKITDDTKPECLMKKEVEQNGIKIRFTTKLRLVNTIYNVKIETDRIGLSKGHLQM